MKPRKLYCSDLDSAAPLKVYRSLDDQRGVHIPTLGGWARGVDILERADCLAGLITTAKEGLSCVTNESWVFLGEDAEMLALTSLASRDLWWIERKSRSPFPPTIVAGRTAPESVDRKGWTTIPDYKIRELIAEGSRLSLSPLPEDLDDYIQPCGIDFRIGRCTVRIRAGEVENIDLADGDVLDVEPGDLVLGATFEEVGTGNDILGVLNTRSSMARQGWSIHRGSNLVQPGSRGWVALEVTKSGQSGVVTFGQRVGNMTVEMMSSQCHEGYTDKSTRRYHRDESPEALRGHVVGVKPDSAAA